MCSCGLEDDNHWYIEQTLAPFLKQIATSPEEAEQNLRSWAARILRKTTMHSSMKAIAAAILSTKHLNMEPVCIISNKTKSDVWKQSRITI